MTILSDEMIRTYIEKGLVIDPLHEPIQPTSVDLRLGDRFIRPEGGRTFDPLQGIGPNPEEDLALPRSLMYLYPGDFILASTREWVRIPRDLVGILVGKSSLARLGLQIESAGYVDPGWRGHLTLEIVNLGKDTIILRPEMLICQIRFEPVLGTISRGYGDPGLNSHYQEATGPQSARLSLPKKAARAKTEPASAAPHPPA